MAGLARARPRGGSTSALFRTKNFAQRSLKPEEALSEWERTRESLGSDEAVERDDLIQVACEALVRSALRCRAAEPAEPYLRRCITGALQHRLRDRVRLVRISRWQHEQGTCPLGHDQKGQLNTVAGSAPSPTRSKSASRPTSGMAASSPARFRRGGSSKAAARMARCSASALRPWEPARFLTRAHPAGVRGAATVKGHASGRAAL